MNKLKIYFNSLLNLGINANNSVAEKRKIKTLNCLNLFVIVCLILGSSNSAYLKSKYPVLIELLFLVIAIVSLVFNYKKKYNASFLLFTFNVNLAIYYVSEYYPIETGAYLFYYPFITSIVLLSDIDKLNKQALVHLGITLFGLVLSLFTSLPINKLEFSNSEVHILWLYNVIFSVITTAFLTLLLARLIFNQNKEVLKNLNKVQHTEGELKQTLKQKDTLLAELHHRVKNNLAIISGLLNLQIDASKNDEVKTELAETKHRILSMALVHKMLYKNIETKKILISDYSHELIVEIANSYNLNDNITLNEKYDEVELSTNHLIPYGLVLNEILTNSIKYGKQNNKLNFSIVCKKNITTVNLIIKDDGNGFSENAFESNNTSLGLTLIKTLSEQLDGEVKFYNKNGAVVELVFDIS
ncbi:MAG: sensor histidine kinase [Bacteroidetes bacterium]|nr:sensor histidine kinase [Bacteroidota bacterium]